MKPSDIQDIFSAHPGVDALVRLCEESGRKKVNIEGLAGSAAAMAVIGLKKRIPRQTFCIVMNDADDAGYFYHDIIQTIGEENILFFPSSFRRALKYGHTDDANRILRTEVMSRLTHRGKEGLVIITHPDAIAEKVASQSDLEKRTINISTGEITERASIEKRLAELGFKEVSYVYEPGEFAVRGSIIDIFSFSSEYPFRLDFFGNEVESIRTFEVDTQLSRERCTEAVIVPKITGTESVAITNFLPKNTVLITKDFEYVKGCVEKLRTEGFSVQAKLSEDELPPMPELMRAVELENFARGTKHWELRAAQSPSGVKVVFDTSPQPLFHKDFKLAASNFKEYCDKGYKILFLTDDTRQSERLKTIFDERGDKIAFTTIDKTIHGGFCDHTLRTAFFTDHQLFGRFHNFRLRSDKARSGKVALTLKELKEFVTGDYIVHIDHGIGKFGGLVRISTATGVQQEAIKLIYKNDDVVFVSIHNLHKISKYRGKEGDTPAVNKLGTGAWERIKERTKTKIKDIARDLIKLYSQRYKEKGFAYSPDSYLQAELEASFIYEDTPDQHKATNDVKKDMERNRPMDRLVCGDVGFGKTEVAIRAAFKAATDGKQVAVLVPTTVLAYQHYLTFKERLKDFPCNVQYLSRARSSADTKKVLAEIKEGKADIVIGTHRLTGKDVQFKDLGLLIIDEEQKFGVAVKEKLRRFKTNVDTLTMTATPIPRTLQFSIMGARDLSMIQTPPPNRYPIHTEIQTFDADVIKEAVNFELSRNGQVFFINNRINNMPELERLIKRSVPDARVCIGHGQMEPAELEKTLYAFINHDYDVLIATSIVENGIDIPNVNTIIINQAQHFGLSDLHQMRGRVGRGKRKAFCYLLTPPRENLTGEARRRLEAIESFSELGSGMHIAMQDLDIRGAGNLLGAEQSGFIADLGYETYQKILAEAVQELKEDEFADVLAEEQSNTDESLVKECFIESDLELLLPAAYVPDGNERILLYRELDSLATEEEVSQFRTRLKDRFGTIPREAEDLLKMVLLRQKAQKMGIEKINLKGGRMKIQFIGSNTGNFYSSEVFGAIISYIGAHPAGCSVKKDDARCIITIDNVKSVETAFAFFEELQQAVEECN